MIDIQGVQKSFGARVLFSDASLRVGARDRIALVGPNGSGKTTLFEMIMGLQRPDAGAVRVTPGASLGYLPQETDALRGRTILGEVLSAAPSHAEAGGHLAVLEREIEASTDPEERDALLAEFTQLQQRFEELGGYTADVDARRILAGLGFGDAEVERMTDTLSGGWLMRVALAKLLLASPDALLLDEPTNHLDLESVRWLERFLSSYHGAILLISHDRDFMNAFATKVVEIDAARLVSYTGDYEAFVRQRSERMEQLAAAAKNQSKKIADTERFINRFRYKASKARQVQSRIKALDKLDRIEVPKEKRRTLGVGFPQPPRSGRVVIELRDVHFSYGEHPVYRGLDLSIERGEKVALVGPNGAGKTTLLKLLAGALDPGAGERILGHNVSVGYFAQHALEALDPENRVIEELQRVLPPTVTIPPRDLLGRFLFSGDDVHKPVSVLSGGERTRLALAKLLVSPVNLLCLDEPTNHLDITSRDALEDAIVAYEGAIVLITHDRHLIRSVANRIVEVDAGTFRLFSGDDEDYRQKTATEAAATPADPRPVPSSPAPATARKARGTSAERSEARKQRAELRRIESELEEVHGEVERLGVLLADPSLYTDGDAATTTKAYESARRRVAELESAWEQLTEVLETTDS